MAGDVKPVPEGYASVTPYLIVKGAAQAIEFYKQVFAATVRMCLEGDGKIGHAEIQIGNSVIMLADEFPDIGAVSPVTLGGTSVGLMVYVNDVDKVFAAAIAAGGKELNAVKDQFYGDRSGTFIDPFGHKWTVATHMEDVSPEEMERRMASVKSGC